MPGALDRQHRRQRRSSVGKEIVVFATVAAVGAAIAVGVALLRPRGGNEVAGAPDRGSAVPNSDWNGQPLPTWARATDGKGFYRYPLDGGTPSYLAVVPTDRGDIAVSPDGSTLAFQRPRRILGPGEIWVVGTDGSSLRRLTHDRPEAWGPASFSPDGERFAYVAYDANGRDQLFTVDLDDGTVRQLTHGGGEPMGMGWPSWSPDGETIVVTRGLPSNEWKWGEGYHVGLYAVDVASGEVQPLRADANSSSGSATYAPDGKTIAFLYWGPGDPMTLATMGVDGRHVQMIGLDVQTGGEQQAPVWSPDGSKIAFDQTNADGIAFGYVMDLTTGGTTRIPASVEGWLDQQTLVVGP